MFRVVKAAEFDTMFKTFILNPSNLVYYQKNMNLSNPNQTLADVIYYYAYDPALYEEQYQDFQQKLETLNQTLLKQQARYSNPAIETAIDGAQTFFTYSINVTK